MLRMSKLTDYGTVVMTYMASESYRLHAASEIAAHTHVALPTVSKILKTLVHEGLVVSYRGVKGGYNLARSANTISMAEIINALEGPIGVTECSSMPGVCSQESSCSVKGNWRRINGAIQQALAGVTLAEMSRPMGHVVSPPSNKSGQRARA